MNLPQPRTAFFISDRTGITAENLGLALLTQFEFLQIKKQWLRFVDTVERARQVLERINRKGVEDGVRPLVFSTLINDEVRAIIKTANCLFVDFFESYISRLEQELDVKSVPTSGHSHGLTDIRLYFSRMDAVNFSLNHDDGSAISHLDQADIVMIGISRTGKTPTCLYLSLHYGMRAANFPLTEDDLEELKLPKILEPHKPKLFGLSTDPIRLQQIRHERLPNSRYASLKQCEFETRQSEALYRKLGIPYLSTTKISIEEIAATIVDKVGFEQNKNPYLATYSPEDSSD
jgi:regulator of PEP synthase PpsR (kinase-PPPase family)